MRFACVAAIAPGDTLAAQCAAIAAAGCAGIETITFPDTPLERWQAEVRQATADAGLQTAAVILGGMELWRPAGLAWAREALPAIAEIGAAALLTAEYRPQDPLPLFPPYPAPLSEELAQVAANMDAISQIARERRVRVMCEPVTQFETRFWRDVETVRTLCQRLNNPQVGLVLDFHNMNITEASIPAAIRSAGPWVQHVHLADSNRRLPGYGHIDFAAGIRALVAIGYNGWYSFECAVTGNFGEELRQTMELLQNIQYNAENQRGRGAEF